MESNACSGERCGAKSSLLKLFVQSLQTNGFVPATSAFQWQPPVLLSCVRLRDGPCNGDFQGGSEAGEDV